MPEERETVSNPLQAEFDRLKGDNARLARELEEANAEAAKRRHESKALEKQVQDATKAAEQLDTLRATVRTMKHEKTYQSVAKGLKVTDAGKFADLVAVSGYKPEADEPDESKIAEAFKATLKVRPWLLDQTEAGASQAEAGASNGATTTHTKPASTPGPGADRGQSHQETPANTPTQPVRRLGVL